MKITDTLKKPRLTEKAYMGVPENRYIFDVDTKASKDDVRVAVETLFNVDVISVKTISVRGKVKRRGASRRQLVRVGRGKKAIVEIKEGQTIKMFDEIFKPEEKSKEK